MEQEPLYKVRAWLAIAELRALSAKWRETRKLVAWCEERRGHGGGLYRRLDLYREGNKPSTAMATIHRRSKGCMQRLGCQRSHGWCGRTQGAPAPPAPPLGLIFRLGAFACMGILEMLVSDFYSLGLASDIPRCP